METRQGSWIGKVPPRLTYPWKAKADMSTERFMERFPEPSEKIEVESQGLKTINSGMMKSRNHENERFSVSPIMKSKSY